MALIRSVADPAQMRAVSAALRRGPGVLRSELTKAFKTAGADTLARVRRNVETLPIRGYRTGRRPVFTARMPGTNIRARISRVTELVVTTGASDPRAQFQVRTDRLGNAANLPWHFDSGATFRHPIMGNRRAWAGQSGTPWFYTEIASDLDTFRAACETAIDATIHAIEG